jgi:hypothetical protein
MEEAAFHSWHSVTNQGDSEICCGQTDDGETKTVMAFMGTDINDLHRKFIIIIIIIIKINMNLQFPFDASVVLL